MICITFAEYNSHSHDLYFPGTWQGLEHFKVATNRMGHKAEITLRSYSSDHYLAKKYIDFFTSKTATIRDTVINSGSSMSDTDVTSI